MLKLGEKDIVDVRLGESQVVEIRKGEDPVWSLFGTIEEIYGLTEQESTNGYQLLDKLPVTQTYSSTGVTFVNNEDGSYTIEGEYNGYAQFISPTSVMLKAGTYALSGATGNQLRNPSGTVTYISLTSAGTRTVTFDEDTEVRWRHTISSASGIHKTKVYPMLERGSIAHPWEPYTGGIPSPSPDYPQEIKSVESFEVKKTGKNLVNQNDLSGKGYWYNSNGELVPNSSWCAYLIPIVGGSTFTISGLGTATISMPYFNGNMEKIGAFSHQNKTFTAPADARYLGFAWVWNTASAGYDGEYIQIEYGSVATTYKPYVEPITRTITPPRPLNAIGEYRDRASVRDGVWRYDIRREPISMKRYDYPTIMRGYRYLSMANSVDSDVVNCLSPTLTYDAQAGADTYKLHTGMRIATQEGQKRLVAECESDETSVSIDLMYVGTDSTKEPIASEDLSFLRNLTLSPGDNLFVTDNWGRDVSYIL